MMCDGGRHSGRFLLLLAIVYLGGCATGRDEPADALAASQGLTRNIVTGTGFQHLIYARPASPEGSGEAEGIHVYLEGDGRPWVTRHRVASDPTASDPLALRLLLRDPATVVYLGRPCYQGLATAEGCGPWLWTHGRYGPDVVQSMVSAIDRALPLDDRPPLTLIGYSGGGVLAMLIAERLEGVERVITIAANLDIDAWADHHGYSRLRGSLNPSIQEPLDPRIRQVHLAGDRDHRVPPWTNRRFMARNPGVTLKLMEGFDHRCCWVEHWPKILEESLRARPGEDPIAPLGANRPG
jgi:pimeloyl-ACP methyl ester carboxylesterase